MKKGLLFALLLAGTLSAKAQKNPNGYPPPGCSSNTTTKIRVGVSKSVLDAGATGSFSRTTEKRCDPIPPPRPGQQSQRPTSRRN